MKWPLGILTPFGELKIYKLNGVGRPRGARLPSAISWQISIVVTVMLQTGWVRDKEKALTRICIGCIHVWVITAAAGAHPPGRAQSEHLTEFRHVLNNHTFDGGKSGVSGLRWPLYSGRRNWWRLKITFIMLKFVGRFTRLLVNLPCGYISFWFYDSRSRCDSRSLSLSPFLSLSL